MGEQIGKTPVADALKMVYEARSIYSDGGIKLLGHKASNPYSTACDNLDKALEILAQVPGAEKQLAKAHIVYGDISNQPEDWRRVVVAREHYEEAKRIFESIGDYDDLESVVAKLVDLRK